jgi:hypothetical protein
MNDIEKYAVGLVGVGAMSYAEDDIDEDDEFADRNDWLAARNLGLKMALAVKNNPDAFHGWYLSTTGQEVEV